MPKRRRSRKTSRKKPYGRSKRMRRRAPRRRRVVNLGKSILPFVSKSTLIYCDNDHSLTSTSGTFARDTYNPIGMYDPDHTGTGHQPLGFDQMMDLYDHYQVIGCKVTFTITSATADCVVGLRLSDGTGLDASLQDLKTFQENPGSKYRFITKSTDNQGTITLSKKISPQKFFGVAPVAYRGETKYTGTVSANPSESMGIHLVCWGLNSTSATIRYSTRISYIARFTEPKSLAGS